MGRGAAAGFVLVLNASSTSLRECVAERMVRTLYSSHGPSQMQAAGGGKLIHLSDTKKTKRKNTKHILFFG